MKKLLLLVTAVIAVALAMAGAQSAAGAVPTISGFAPASGPPDWSVTLSGTGFSGAVEVTLTPTDPAYLPEDATFTVDGDTSIVATVPFFAIVPLDVTLTVTTPDGSAASSTDFAVDGQVAISEYRGSSGEPIALTGSGFTGATQVVFGTWSSPVQGDEPFALTKAVGAHFRVLGDTKIAVTVPALRAGDKYWVEVVSPTGTSVSDHSSPFLIVRPRLLRNSSNAFAIRPATVNPSGDGSFLIGKLYSTGRGRAIRWLSWNTDRAYGLGTVWIDNGIPDEARGTFYGYRGSVAATRVRGGRYTRLTVSWKQNGRTRREALKLTHAYSGSGWFWN
jgi:hypothetical protein